MAHEAISYSLSRLDGQAVDQLGVYLVLRLDRPENDLERLAAAIFANLTRNTALGAALQDRLQRITGEDVLPGPIRGQLVYAEGLDAGLAG